MEREEGENPLGRPGSHGGECVQSHLLLSRVFKTKTKNVPWINNMDVIGDFSYRIFRGIIQDNTRYQVTIGRRVKW